MVERAGAEVGGVPRQPSHHRHHLNHHRIGWFAFAPKLPQRKILETLTTLWRLCSAQGDWLPIQVSKAILAYLTSKALLAFPASIVILSLHIFIAVPVIVIRRQELYKGSTRNIIPWISNPVAIAYHLLFNHLPIFPDRIPIAFQLHYNCFLTYLNGAPIWNIYSPRKQYLLRVFAQLLVLAFKVDTEDSVLLTMCAE